MKLFNIVISSRSERERERERESNLNFASSLKKSFTLIELSIVLLILSLLVGSLLVGRQIVDRAKIQRIIFEFDYYEKAFHQFYDTYRVVPGSLSEKACEKYSAFKNYYISRNIKTNNWTGCKCCTSHGAVLNPKLIESWHVMPGQVKRQAIASGLFEGTYEGSASCYYENANVFLSGHWLNNTGSSFEATMGKEHRLAFLGFDFQRMLASGETMAHYLNYGFSGSNKYYNASLPHEIENNVFKKQIDHHNVIFYFYHREASYINTNQGSRANEMNTWNGVLSPKLSSQLDSKLDDGRPGTGSILAMKSGFGHRSGATEEEHKAVCYDQRADEVDKAIYQSDSNMKYGCNIMKIMSDVKYFLQIKIGVFRVVYMVAQLHNINVKLRAYNSNLLDKATVSFVNSVKNVGGVVCGPIPMPKKVERFTVNRSPHVNKKSMEKFVKTTYTRLVRILGVTPALIDELSKVEILSGVGVEISITN